MVFSSLVFIYFFLPIALLGYFLLPKNARITWLLLCSLLFYGYGEPRYIALMLLSIAANFGFGALVGKYRDSDRKKAKFVVGVSVAFNLLLLCVFKYLDFLLQSALILPFLSSMKPLGIALPIGVSFYTFQSMSYAIDVYRHDADVQRSPVKFAMYVSFFPQLIAGPIVRYKTIAAQLERREESAEKFRDGVLLFIAGLSKKVLLADSFGALWGVFEHSAERGVVGAWLGIAAFALQIYYDFSGYSDMARGLGKLFGFEFDINFNYPYTARSVSEFWSSRWHISLGTWFKEYLYIPLGGSRCSAVRNALNLAIVWLLTGLWHGASWNFLLWGGYYAIVLIFEKKFLEKRLKRAPAALGIAYTLFIVLVGWVIFALTDAGEAAACLGDMFGFGAAELLGREALYELRNCAVLLLIGIFGCTPLPRAIYSRAVRNQAGGALQTLLCAAALALCTAYIVSSSYSPFLYFRF